MHRQSTLLRRICLHLSSSVLRLPAQKFAAFLLAMSVLTPAHAREVWQAIGPAGGSVTAVDAAGSNRSEIFVATRLGGIYRATSAEGTWKLVNTGLDARTVYTIVSDPRGNGSVFAGTEQGLYMSANRGDTWHSVRSLPTNASGRNMGVVSLAIDADNPSIIYLGTFSHGIYKSIDGGATWTESNSGLGSRSVSVITIDAKDRNTVFAGTLGRAVFKSTDGGRTWRTSSRGLPSFVVQAMAATQSDPNTLYVALTGSRGGLAKTIDGGANWTTLKGPSLENISVAVDPLDANRVLVGTYGLGLFESTDAGANWRQIDHPQLKGADVRSIAFLAGGNPRVVVGTTSGLIGLTQAGAVQPVGTGLMAMRVGAIAVTAGAPKTILAGTDKGIERSTDNGKTWELVGSALPGIARAIAPLRSGGMLVGTANGIVIGDRLAKNWQPAAAPAASVAVNAIAPMDGGQRIFVAGTNSGAMISSDGGNTWIACGGELAESAVLALEFVPGSLPTLYAGTDRGMFVSTDLCRSWRPVRGAVNARPITAIAASRRNPMHLIAGSVDAAFQSLDGGRTWRLMSGALEGHNLTSVVFHPKRPGTVYVATADAGVFRSGDGARSWTELNRGLNGMDNIPMLRVSGDGSLLLASTLGAGVFSLPLNR